MRRSTILLATAFCVAGCSSYSPAPHDAPPGKAVIYEIPVERAQRIVLIVMSSHFAGREVTSLPPPAIGYSTYTRMMLDTWSTTVTITPVTARVGATEAKGVRIEASGGGSQVLSGRVVFEDFKERLKSELDRTGQMRLVDSYVIN